MSTFNGRRWFAPLALVAVAFSAQRADAFGHGWMASCGSWGGYTMAVSTGSSGGSSGGYARQGLFHRIFHHKSYRRSLGSWGSSYGSSYGYTARRYGSSGSWGGSRGSSYGSSYSSSYGGSYAAGYSASYSTGYGYGGSTGSSYGGSSYGGSWGNSSSGGSWGGSSVTTPAVEYETYSPQDESTSPTPPPTPEEADSAYRLHRGNATLTVNVPEDAQVFVNDTATRSTGQLRQYVSRGLQRGKSYTYRVRAEVIRNGQTITETKLVRLTPGGSADLDFVASLANTPEAIAAQTLETKLTLHVPEDAKVFLSGAPTKQTGTEREYATSRLKNGETWKDYTIRIVSNIDGQEVVEERTVDLVAGKSMTLDFADAGPRLAQANR